MEEDWTANCERFARKRFQSSSADVLKQGKDSKGGIILTGDIQQFNSYLAS